MANECTMAASISCTKNGGQVSASASLQASVTAETMQGNVQAVGTAAEQIAFGDVTPKYVFLKNLDTTNYVEIALDSGVSTQIWTKLSALEFTIFPVKTATMYAKANTAGINLQIVGIPA